jgi:hypothetical protein
MAGAIIVDYIRQIRKELERRPPAWHEVKALKTFARHFP